ncbi:hypothetical protein R1flu_006108 [Riccia fluitans]|uniref:Uncharacterized protein n=1 Tax=Riccia fluitans TaxID=41844 RepID=A0ABD1YXX0_9MARC
MAEPIDDSGGSPPRGIPSGAGSLEMAGSTSGHDGFDLHTDAEGTGPGGTLPCDWRTLTPKFAFRPKGYLIQINGNDASINANYRRSMYIQ